MKRRDFLKATGAAAAAGLPLAHLARSAGRDDRPPNIVFIFIDDMGWRDLGFMGSSYYDTPNVDRLAHESMVFTDAYANAPNCAPTRACLLTGQYTPRHGIYTVGSPARGPAHLRKLIPIENNTVLPRSAITIADALQRAGYVSASMGKWHMGDPPDNDPTAQGFDVNIGGNHHGHPPAGYFPPYNLPNMGQPDPGEYLTDRLTDEAVNFIERNQENPFFLYLTHYGVHTPLQAPENMVDKYREREPSQGHNNPVYGAMVESIDHSTGRVLDTLDRLGLSDDTVVIFFSDNGGLGGYRKWDIMGNDVTSQAPLRGGKGMLYEGGIREPLAIRWPGVVEPGSVCHTPVIGTDFYPTLLDIAGISKKPEKVLDGKSLMPLLTGNGGLGTRSLHWHFPAYLQAGQGTWRTTPAAAIRRGAYKLLEYFEDGRLELYNLQEDIGELNNLAAEMPGKTREMHRRMVRWREDIDAPVPTEKNPLYDPDAQS